MLNYHSARHSFLELAGLFLKGGPRKILQMLRKFCTFRQAQQSLNLSPVRSTSSVTKISEISQNFDYIIVGSDIVWSHETKALGPLSIYFGVGLNPRKGLVAFAASMGPSAKELPSRFSEGLSRFKAISVRDKNTQSVLVRAGISSDVISDPTLLLDVHAPEFSEYLPSDIGPYLLVYCSPLDRKTRLQLSSFAESRGLNIVVTGYYQVGLGVDFSHLGPYEWLGLFLNADFVVTNTFHGTVFSTLSGVSFITLDRDAIRNKARDYLSRLGLDRHYSDTGFNPAVLELEVDWETVGKLMRVEGINSANFLRSALNL